MKIGIDLGGSHIAVGLVDENKIILKRERDFLEEDKNNIEKVIEHTVIKFIKNILDEKNIKLSDIELIGISAPRNK